MVISAEDFVNAVFQAATIVAINKEKAHMDKDADTTFLDEATQQNLAAVQRFVDKMYLPPEPDTKSIITPAGYRRNIT